MRFGLTGWIRKCKDNVDQVNEVLRFYGVASSRQWRKLWLSPGAAFRKSKAFAAQQGISPAIIVGRLQHEGLIPLRSLEEIRADLPALGKERDV
jgi:hypothetical protein